MQGGRMTTWKEGRSRRAAGAGRDPGCGAGGGGVRCPRCRGGRRRAAGAEPRANTGWRRRRESCLRRRAPRARESDRAGTGGGQGGRGGAAPKPRASEHPPYQPHLWLRSPPPSPLPPEPPSRCRGGGGTREPRLQSRTPRGCCGPRSCLPGAAEPGAEAARPLEPGAGRGAASSFPASPGLRPGHGAARRGRAAAAVLSAASAAAAADGGRPVAAGSLCE